MPADPHLARGFFQPRHFPAQLLVFVFGSTSLSTGLLQTRQQHVERDTLYPPHKDGCYEVVGA
jgi:hypothetical protein